MIYLGADHRGFELKQRIKKLLIDEGYEVTDLGNDHLDPNDDYVVFAKKVAQAVVGDPQNKGVLFCGSGAGMDMVANKVRGVRSALVFDVPRAIQAREHEDANVLSLPTDILDEEVTSQIVESFLNTQFSNEERHIRRIKDMEALKKED